MTGLLDDPARAAAVTAARARIEPGMTIGLGSGREARISGVVRPS